MNERETSAELTVVTNVKEVTTHGSISIEVERALLKFVDGKLVSVSPQPSQLVSNFGIK